MKRILNTSSQITQLLATSTCYPKFTKNIPGRPICSSVTHPTARISKFIDAHIKDYAPKNNSYIRDTQDFITKIKSVGQIPEGAFFVTLDVSSLYTNIPNQE